MLELLASSMEDATCVAERSAMEASVRRES